MKQLFIKDLDKYTESDLLTMAKYYGIKKLYPRSTLLESIAGKIMTTHQGKYKKANMVGSKDKLPYGGDLSKARRAGDREAIREIVKWQREQESLPKESEESEIEKAKDCSNDTDFITQEKWTENPDIKIHFLDWENPDKKPYTICLKRDSFEKWITMPENYFARWVQKDPKKPMDDVGHGGHPLEKQIYLKMPDGVTFVQGMPPSNENIGIALEQVRLGTLAGTFGISELHGQAPGYKVYTLIPKEDYNLQTVTKLLRDYIDKDRSTDLGDYGKSKEDEEDEFTEPDRQEEFLQALEGDSFEEYLEESVYNGVFEFEGMELEDSTIIKLAKALGNNTTVTNLDLVENNITDDSMQALANLLRINKSIKKLNLNHNQITDSGIVVLANALKVNNTLDDLDLSGNLITYIGIKYLTRALKDNKTLTTLKLSSIKITNSGLLELGNMLRVNNTLHTLWLVENKIDDDGVKLLTNALKVNKSLITIHLDENNIADAGAKDLAEMLKINNTLETIELNFNNITNIGATALDKALESNTSIIKINIINNLISERPTSSRIYTESTEEEEENEEVIDAVHALETNSITELDLSESGLYDSDVKLLAQAMETNSTLTLLYLGDNNIGYVAAQALAKALETNATLTALFLGSNNISDVGAQRLAKALVTNSTLTTLNISGNNISDVGAQHLAMALETNTTLTTLNLMGNKISDTGAQALANVLETNTTLTTLNLGYNNINPTLEQQIKDIMDTRPD